MCLSIPAKVVALSGPTATVEVAGNRREADVSMLDHVAVGDYVLLHAGFAIGTYDQEDAEETLRLWEQIAEASQGQDPGTPDGRADGTNPAAGRPDR